MRAWTTAREAAGLPDLHIHDLRHGAASFMINAGIDLFAVGRIPGVGANAAICRRSPDKVNLRCRNHSGDGLRTCGIAGLGGKTTTRLNRMETRMSKPSSNRRGIAAAVRPALFAGAASVFAVASPALAQDDSAAPLPSAAATDHTFSGPWVGAVVGYDITKAGSNYDNASYDQRRRNAKGLTYGGAIGFDHDFGRVVLGVEAEGMGSKAHANYADNALNPGFGLARVTAGRDIYGGVRAGYKLSPNLLAYGKFGYTNAAYNLYTTDGTTAIRDRVHAQGYRAGAGLEYAMQHGLFVKAEYRYSDYARTNYGVDATDVNLNAVRHQVVGSVGLRF